MSIKIKDDLIIVLSSCTETICCFIEMQIYHEHGIFIHSDLVGYKEYPPLLLCKRPYEAYYERYWR